MTSMRGVRHAGLRQWEIFAREPVSIPLGLAIALIAAPAYRPAGATPLGAPDRWVYMHFDPASARVYVAHGDRLTVVDGYSGAIVGEVAGIAGGTHGIVASPRPIPILRPAVRRFGLER